MSRRPLRDALLEHQQAIGALLDEAELLLQSADPARAPMMMLLRLRLTQRLRCYKEFKHNLLFDPLCGQNGTAVERLACEMRTRCNAMGDSYLDHVKTWPDMDIDAHWRSYKEAAERIVAAIRQHIACERKDAEQLLWVRLWRGR